MNSQSLTDLESLILTARTERAKKHIADAYAAYQAGAYRAAIVVTWIAVVFDLIDKIRELVLAGDKQAKVVVDDYDKFLAQLDEGDKTVLSKALEFERNILSLAKIKFSFFDQHQILDLQRLYDDRNRCAHPTFQSGNAPYEPTAELARLHLRNAITHVLSLPPVQGKAALDAIFESIASQYFPRDLEKAKILLAEGPLGMPTDALVTGAVDRLFWGMFTAEKPQVPRVSAIWALRAVLELHRKIAEPRLKSQAAKLSSVKDEDLVWLSGAAAGVPELWEGLPAGQQARIEAYVMAGPMPLLTHVLRLGLKAPALGAVAAARVKQLNQADLVALAEVSNAPEVVARAVDLFATASNWAAANSIYDTLIRPLFDQISVEQARKIFYSPSKGSSDLKFSGGLQRFEAAVRQSGLIPTAELDDLLTETGLEYLLPSDEGEAT